MARLQNSVVFKAARELDFQRDMIGSINLLMCSRGTDSNSTNRDTSLRSLGQIANTTRAAVGNNSGG